MEPAKCVRSHSSRSCGMRGANVISLSLCKKLIQLIIYICNKYSVEVFVVTRLCTEITLFKSRSCERGFLIVGGMNNGQSTKTKHSL